MLEQKIDVGLDRRASFSMDDRKVQYAETMRAHALFGRMSELVDRLNGVRALLDQRSAGLDAGSGAHKALAKLGGELEVLRKEIVATKEGGDITGEERLREHLDTVYGALLSYEGRPGDYQIARVNVLQQELAGVVERTNALLERELPKLNQLLRKQGLEEITLAAAEAQGARLAAVAALEQAGERTAWGAMRGERD